MQTRHPSRPQPRPVALAVALALAQQCAPGAAHANPTGAQVVHGQVQITQPDARSTLIRQGSDKAILDWQGFSIAPGERVEFRQPGAGSVALNRVTGGAPSEIHGSLSANGKVFLVNPAGVLFGKEASVDVGSLVASTLGIGDDDFLAGRYTFSDGGAAGTVRNLGRLSAGDAGTIALLGAQVSNEGTISARLGTAGLAAGGKVSLDFGSAGLARIVVDAAGVNALVENGGAVLADGGQVILTARALGLLTDTVIHHGGVARATSLVERDGRIVLDGGERGVVAVAGSLDASSAGAGLRGGQVTISGHDIVLAAGGAIDVRGDAGGGRVLVGGGYRGADPSVRHAAGTTMAAGSSIRADGTGSGDGGTIVLWSDGLTRANGSLSARGGAQGGNGGLIETSGRRIDIAGLAADASAARGTGGTWLIDPDDVTIDSAFAGTISSTLDNGTSTAVDSDGSIFIGAEIIKASGGDARLTFNAAQDISMGYGSRIVSRSGKLHVDFNADAASPATSPGAGAITLYDTYIQSNGGDIRLYGQSDPARGSAMGHGGSRHGIDLSESTLDTRTEEGAGAAGGNILLRGTGFDTRGDEGWGGNGVSAWYPRLHSASGAIVIDGTAGSDSGQEEGGAVGVDLHLGAYSYGGAISTTSGDLLVTGRDATAASTGNGGRAFGANAVRLYLGQGTRITTQGGDILVRGDSYGGIKGASPSDNDTAAVAAYIAGGEMSAGGALEITGIAHGDAAYGVSIDAGYGGAIDLSAGARGMRLAGRADTGTGVDLRNVAITTRDGGQLSVAGESRLGIGLYAGETTLGDTAMTGDVVLRAYSSAPDLPTLVAQRGDGRDTVATAGVVAILPGGVDDDGAFTGALDVPIGVGDRTDETPGFNVALSQMGLGRTNAARVVIGSREHRGRIVYDDAQSFSGDLTLQNGGAGSRGIALNSAVDVSGQLTLSSGGQVDSGANGTGDAPSITASGLLLHGARPESRFLLTSSGNRVGRFAATFDGANLPASNAYGGVIFTHDGALEVGDLAGAGLSGTGNAVTSIRAQETRVAGSMLVKTSGDLRLGHAMSTNGGDLTLAVEGRFLNPDGNQLGGSGAWRVFAPTWVGEIRGNLAVAPTRPNYYGCAYGSGCADGIGGSRFFYRDRPRLTVTPDAISREYGDPNPAIGYRAAELINGDALADAVLGRFSTRATISSPLGSYATTGEFTSPVGYELTVLPGVLTVSPATLVVSVDDQRKVYGGADPLLSASISGFKFDDTRDVVSGLSLATATGRAATAGTHAITGRGATAANYRFTYQAGTLTVAKAPLQVRIDDQAKTYGDADARLSAAFAGFQYDDTAAVVNGLALSTATGKAATAGTHRIVGAGASAANYDVVYLPGTLRVARAPLEILVDDQRKRYGDADPALSYRLAGLKYDDTAGDVGAIVVSTATGAAATAGSHAIVASTGASTNYTAVTRPGTLVVDKAPLIVHADDKTKVYGDAEPRFSASMRGLQYADTAAVVAGLVYDAPAGAAAGAGLHAITVAGGSADNYTLAYQPGSLRVEKAPLVLSADDATKVYGAADPVLSGSASGLKYGDTRDVVRGLALSAPRGAAATVGSHAIEAANGGADNYAISYRPGVLNVEPAVLTYTAAPAFQFQDLPSAPLAGIVTGFVYGDSLATVTDGTLSFSSAATANSPLGAYAVQGSGLAAANYRFVQAPSNETALTVFVSPSVFRPAVHRDVTFESSNVYEKNFGTPQLCAAVGPLGAGLAGAGEADILALEWSRVRVSPNLSNCLGLGQRNGCADF